MFHIVDDDMMVGGVLAELIGEFGHDVFLFSNPVEYLEFIKAPEYVSPVAIFSDVIMPQMNGYDFMHQVKLMNPQQKFVIVTGSPELEHVYKHLACMYLYKPFLPDLLNSMVSLLMQCRYKCCVQDGEHIDDIDKFNIDCWSCPHGLE